MRNRITLLRESRETVLKKIEVLRRLSRKTKKLIRIDSITVEDDAVEIVYEYVPIRI